MSRPPKSPVADCLYCNEQVRQSAAGWRTRRHGDPSPLACGMSPDRHHAPSPVPALTEGQRIIEEMLLLDSGQDMP